jgi:hypothetical protein
MAFDVHVHIPENLNLKVTLEADPSVTNKLDTIMGMLTNYLANQTEFNRRQGEAVESLALSLDDLGKDIQVLNDKITDLQNSPDRVTDDDAARITDLETTGNTLTGKFETIAAALKGLREQTPPAVPPDPDAPAPEERTRTKR